MPHPISPLGWAHTLLSLIPLVAGIYCFIRYGAIRLEQSAGKIYLYGLGLAVITALIVASNAAGRIFSVLVMLCAIASVVIPNIRFLGRARPYLATFAMSFSFLLSLVPTTNETLSRLPPSAPLAHGPSSPIVVHTLLLWLVLFVVGFAAQCWHLRKEAKAAA